MCRLGISFGVRWGFQSPRNSARIWRLSVTMRMSRVVLMHVRSCHVMPDHGVLYCIITCQIERSTCTCYRTYALTSSHTHTHSLNYSTHWTTRLTELLNSVNYSTHWATQHTEEPSKQDPPSISPLSPKTLGAHGTNKVHGTCDPWFPKKHDSPKYDFSRILEFLPHAAWCMPRPIWDFKLVGRWW